MAREFEEIIIKNGKTYVFVCTFFGEPVYKLADDLEIDETPLVGEITKDDYG